MNPDTLLTRDEFAVALTKAGYPTAASTLATMKCRGGGPPVQTYGRTPLYQWGPGLAWAEARLTRSRKAA